MDIAKESKGLIRDTYRNFIFNYRAMLYFEVLYKLLAMFIFIPINYFILNNFMGTVGVHNITNTDLLKFGLSIKGIFYIGFIVIVSFIAVFIEMGILTYMANKSHKQDQVSLLEGAINSFRILPQTFSIHMIFLVFLAGIVGPLTGIGLYSSMIRRLTIPSFITIELNKTLGGTILLWLFNVIVIILLLRWILSIPAVIIENIKLKEAFKNSKKIFKSNRLKIVGYIITWVIVYFIIKLILALIPVTIGWLLLKLLEGSGLLSFVVAGLLISIFFIGYIFLQLVTLPLFISFLVELYYTFRNYEIEERMFKSLDEYEERRIVRFVTKYKKIIVTSIAVIFWFDVSVLGVSSLVNRVIEKDVEVSAHRGSSLKAPENSIASVKKAIEEGADYAEIDVVTTKDNEVVLFHDTTLKRIDGTNRAITDLTLAEVKNVDNGSYFSPEFKEERIPELEEILKLAKGKIKLNIELKPMKENDILPEKVAELIHEYDMVDEVVVASLDYDSIQMVKEYNPLIKVGYILTIGLGDFTKLNIDFISVEYEMLKKELVYAMHTLDKEVYVWTINDEERAEEAIKIGVDNIITDNVDLVQTTQEKLKEKGIPDYLTWFYESINSIVKYVKI